jgi:Tfp pilus assembly protein PilN
MIKINLHPKKKVALGKSGKDFLKLELPRFTAPDLKVKGIIYILIPVVLLGLEALYYLKLDLEISRLNSEKNQIEIQIQRFKSIQQAIKSLENQLDQQKRLESQIEAQILVYKNFAVEKKGILNILYQISKNMPDGVWIVSLDIGKDNATLRGYALKPEIISLFYKNLSKYFRNISFNATERQKGKTIEFYRFEFQISGWIKNNEGG